MKLLVVEDESKTGEYLRQGLTEAGFVVDLVANGLDGQHLALNEAYDLIILDVMLPDLDGWRILQTIRAADNPVPVLFLTARDSVADRVRGLELGADDYLVKPFAFSELLARVRTLLRRGTCTASDGPHSGGRSGAGFGQAPGVAGRAPHHADQQGVCAAGVARSPARRGAATLVDCLPGLGHEL